MTIEELKQTKYYQFVIQQKYLVMIISASVVMLLIVIVLSVRSAPSKTIQLPAGITSTKVQTTAPAQKSSWWNPLTWVAPKNNTATTTSTGTSVGSTQQSTTTQQVVPTVAPQSTGISSFNGTALTKLTNSGVSLIASNPPSTQTSSGTSGSTGGSSGSSGSSSAPTPTPPIQMIFENPGGGTTTYIPPGTPPTEVKWGRYTSFQDNYSIDYPVNWQIEITNVAGHQGVAVFAPGTNKKAPGTPYIGFGLTPTYLHVAEGQLANTLDTPILIDEINGTFYSDGSLGNSYMASIFPNGEGNFGLGSNSSDATFAYVYYFMLHSLRFSTQ